MKKFAVFVVIILVATSIPTCDKVLSLGMEWFSECERDNFIADTTAESLARRTEALSKSKVENTGDIVEEANMIADTLLMGIEVEITPTYKVFHRKKDTLKIETLEKTFKLEGNNPVYRVLIAHEIAMALVDNEIVADVDDDRRIRISGCRINWKHLGQDYYLMDTELKHHWSLAGCGEFYLNRVHGKNEINVEEIEGITLQTIHDLF